MFTQKLKKCFLIISALLLSLAADLGVASAEKQGDIGAESDTCFSTHTFGAGPTKFDICFSNHGNLMQMTSPAGFEHIALGTLDEGYILCDLVDPPSFYINYYDHGSGESGFGNPVIIQPGGPNTFPLTITRTTTDGNFTLKQIFSRNNLEKEVKIVMWITNNTNVKRTIILSRYFDGDIDNDYSDDYYARTTESVWGWEGETGHGLMLTTLSHSIPHTTSVQKYPYPDETPKKSCVHPTIATPAGPDDLVGYLDHTLNIPPYSSKKVIVQYKRF